jgi:hypothetical protein
VGEGGPGQLSSRPPNYPLITSPDTLTLIHLFVFPSAPSSPSPCSSFLSLSLSLSRSPPPPLPPSFPTPSLRRGWLATARLSPPVVNKNRSAELQVPVPVLLARSPSPLPSPPLPPGPCPFRASRTSGYFFSDRAIERHDGWTFARPEIHRGVQLLRIIVQGGNWPRFHFNTPHLIFTVTKFAIYIHLPHSRDAAVRGRCGQELRPREITMISPYRIGDFIRPAERSERASATIAATISYQVSARAVHARAYTGLANW